MRNNKVIANNIQRLLDENGKDRYDLANDTGINYNTFASWMQAKSYPRIDKIEKMANYFNVSKSELMENNICENTFGMNLNNLRDKHKLSMDELSERLNKKYDTKISKSTISRWENGTAIPKITYVNLLADYFNVPSSELINDSGVTMENNIYENIKSRANQLGISVQEVALKAGIGENSIYRWQNNTINPNITSLKKVAQVLNIGADELINGNMNDSVPQFNKIQTEIAFKRFEDDDTYVVYSNEKLPSMMERMSNVEGLPAGIAGAVDKFQDFFTPEFESGSNQVWLKHEPDSFKLIYIPKADILYIREVDYKYRDEV